MKGWRETGIVFYVLKPVRPGSPPKSELWVTPEDYILGISGADLEVSRIN